MCGPGCIDGELERTDWFSFPHSRYLVDTAVCCIPGTQQPYDQGCNEHIKYVSRRSLRKLQTSANLNPATVDAGTLRSLWAFKHYSAGYCGDACGFAKGAVALCIAILLSDILQE